MSQSLAIKYRPATLSEMMGQTITTKILEKAIEHQTYKNAYLFAGPSGCGKTSISRCFANAINRGIGEPIEVDAASNNGVDNVRAIIEAATERSLVGEYKIFIIDECHMITTAGWNAFLKGLEETPSFTIFMFCTTEPNKIPETVLNRMQRYNITKISTPEIEARLKAICAAEGFTNYEQACDLISKTAQGCMRDAIMRLDQCADFNKDLSLANVKQVLSVVSYEAMFILANALYTKDTSTVLYVIDKLYNSGADLKNFIELFLCFILDLHKCAIFKTISVTNIPSYLEANLVEIIASIQDNSWYTNIANILLQIKLETKYDSYYKSTIEAFLLKACQN